MAKRRNDTGDLYEVFRKITATQKTLAEQNVERETAITDEGRPVEGAPKKEFKPQTLERAFIVRYNTAVITFIAFIFVVVWAYYTGYQNGRKSERQERSENAAQNIPHESDKTIDTISLMSEKTAPKEFSAVQVYSGVTDEQLEQLKDRIAKKLENEGYKTFIAKADDETYYLWIGRFPRGSTEGGIILEKMKGKTSRSGGRAFKDPAIVNFESKRIVE